MACKICGKNGWSILYKGPIRMGKFGNLSKTEHIIWKCKYCQAGFLNRPPLNYELPDYRRMVDENSSPEHFYALHDQEQAENINMLGTQELRGKLIMDVGCGAGSFLDMVKGYASGTIAIEPAKSFHAELKRKGHRVFSYGNEALKKWKRKVDIAVSFAVIEHVEEPLKFLKEIKQLLKPGGYLFLGTPNYRDWLIELLPRSYASFFYRYVHTWYFNKESLRAAGNLAGFRKIEIDFAQRFDLSNAFLWARDNCPTGLGRFRALYGLDAVYRHYIAESGRSDFIYARMYR